MKKTTIKKINMKYIQNLAFISLFLILLGCSHSGSGKKHFAYESAWEYAKELQMQGRYALAKEYYLIALSEAETYNEQKWIEKDLRTLEMQIKSRR